MQPYEEILDAMQRDVSFGSTTIHIFRAAELGAQQVGYSVTATGESLIGEKDGDWLKTWLVIGYEDLCGDPIFINTLEVAFPVYTAAHGEGRWDAVQIADSLLGFGSALSAIVRAAKGRKHPLALENNPLKPLDRETTLADIREHNPSVNLGFWEAVLE